MRPGFKSRLRLHTWVEFVDGSLPCAERFFSGYSGFPLSSKMNISKFHFDQESGRRRTTLCMCYLQIFIYLFIYLLFTAKVEPWFSQVTTKPLYENERATAFWNVLLFADTTRVKANRIDATIIDKTRNQVREIELSCPWLENREIESLKISRRQRSTVNWD